MKVLIIKLGAIGDVIRTTSILSGLKDKYPDSSIDWVTKKESMEILKGNKLLSDLFPMESIDGNFHKKEYDWVISLDDEKEACSLASGVKSKKITGAFMENNRRAYTNDSSPWFDMGLISRLGKHKADELKAKNGNAYQQLIYEILNLRFDRQEPIIKLDEKALDFARTFAAKNNIGSKEHVIGINTGAGGRWEGKKLGIQNTARLIDDLNVSLHARIILFGGPEEKERNRRIIGLAKTKLIDAGCDNTLMEFAALVNLCDILVTSDSLALHIGTALKKKIVVFFGPTSSAEIELYGRGIKIIPKKGCLCCYKPKCEIPPEYDVQDIADAVRSLL